MTEVRDPMIEINEATENLKIVLRTPKWLHVPELQNGNYDTWLNQIEHYDRRNRESLYYKRHVTGAIERLEKALKFL